eukprot:TRINITY_DN12187_c0_g1_i1.p1 TRINITY_DN12187_c0_g1~~TRINITY_DN12187_c0_g1_i1.p1  ORF type:complete len:447 (+),score=156.98 TRINITY_DN12187_c0_g1_i1:49-1341(+)
MAGRTYEYLLTTSLGMTDVAAKEVALRLPGGAAAAAGAFEPGCAVTVGEGVAVEMAPWGLESMVRVAVTGRLDARNNDVVEKFADLRGVHDVLLHHAHLPLPEADNQPLALYDMLKDPACGVEVDTLKNAAHFRVTCQRLGKHKFQSSDVEMEVGGALHERYGLPAKMKNYMVCVRADVVVNTVIIGTLLNTTPDMIAYSKRHKLAFVRTVTLKPNVAYAMLDLARVQDGDAVLDPFVGSGTILLEALECFPNVTCAGLDRSAAAVKGSTANAVAAGLADRVSFVQGNARTLHKSFGDKKFDKIVSNFPWGLKTGATADIRDLYRGVLYSCFGALKPGGIMCCIVLHDAVTIQLLRAAGCWDILHARVVKTGGKLPAVIVARRKDEPDGVLPSLKHQRNGMYRYIQDHENKAKDDVRDKEAEAPTPAAEK